MADPNCSSPEPRVAKGKDILDVDCTSSQLELPDNTVNVVSLLGLWDVFTLGSCSKFLNELCGCESTWKLLYIRRWGPLSETKAEFSSSLSLTAKGWKALYIIKHREMASVVCKIIESIMSHIIDEIYLDYNLLRAAEQMKALNITFEDIYFFFFRRDINVILNFVALYYSYFCLRVPIEDIRKAVTSRQLADRVVCIRWTCPQNWDHGFYMPEENFTEINSLGDIAKLETHALYLFKRPNYPHNRIHNKLISDLYISSVIPQTEADTWRCDCATSATSTAVPEYL